jgi:urate oxidase / 2-oxo-4-hydroxy-4-carboxy-5-ureidoimidazoline decarboxylase
MTTGRWSLAEINGLDRDAFVARLGFLFEGSPWVAAAAWPARPWADRAALHRSLVEAMRAAADARKLALIRAHPDLVGRAALAGRLTASSTAEQRTAGLDPNALTPEEVERFAAGNAAYRARFDFPFVICARENRKEAILAGLAARLGNDRAQEIETALGEIEKIAWHRLIDAVEDDDAPDRGGNVSGYDYEISYGKRRVPVYRVYARPLEGVAAVPESTFRGRSNTLLACEVDVEVFGGDFLPAYTIGDNSMVVATDSMKNFILRESLTFDGATLEGLLHHLALGFASTYEQLRSIRLSARELPFTPVSVPAGDRFVPSDRLYDERRGDFGTATLRVERTDDGVAILDHACGRADLHLMKITGSSFTSFVRDGYTTLPERKDRPLFIYLDIGWRYADPMDGFGDDVSRYVPSEQVRDVAATVFEQFVSESIQHLMHEMGTRLLDRFPQLAEVSFDGQNRTRDPYAVSETDERLKVYSDPFSAYGNLKLRMVRR